MPARQNAVDEFLKALSADYGLLGLILAGVVAYFLRAETVFWREREDFKARLQKNHDDFSMIMRERLAEQQALVKELTGAIDKIEERVRLAEMEFVKLQETILSKLEQMQLYRQSSGQNKGLPN